MASPNGGDLAVADFVGLLALRYRSVTSGPRHFASLVGVMEVAFRLGMEGKDFPTLGNFEEAARTAARAGKEVGAAVYQSGVLMAAVRAARDAVAALPPGNRRTAAMIAVDSLNAAVNGLQAEALAWKPE